MTETNSFRLTRYFSIASAIGSIVLLVVVAVLLIAQAEHELVELQSDSNADVSKMLGKVIWPSYTEFGKRTLNIEPEQLSNQPEIYSIRNELLPFLENSAIQKVKIYNSAGTVIFSTEPAQIGGDHTSNPGFLRAFSGSVTSQLTHRGEFYTYNEVIFDRSIISSYVPITDPESKEVQVVFEVYSDVSELVEEITEASLELVGLIFAGLLFLYVFLYRIVSRADGIITEQEAERERFLEKIHQMAYFDELTKLANRANFNEKLKQAIARAKRSPKYFGLMYFDLDGFKEINDTLGHSAGDKLLITVAGRLNSAVRESDLIFRIGGDEFTGIFENIDSITQLEQMAEKIIADLNQPIMLEGKEVIASASIGLAIYPESGKDSDALLNSADVAMYRAKEKGKNCYSA